MNKQRIKELAILGGHALVLWMLCGGLVGVGRALTTMDNTLLIHAIGAPLGAALVAAVYFRRYAYTGPWTTAAIFTATPVVLDLTVVAPLIEGNFEMFNSAIGLWIPLASIFVTTGLVGTLFERLHKNHFAEA